jgi:hypothetical protein
MAVFDVFVYLVGVREGTQVNVHVHEGLESNIE